MPKKLILKTVIIILLLCFACKYIYDNYKVESKTSLFIKESTDCDTTLKDYYTTEKIDYYLYCIDDVVVDFTDRTLELNKALAARQIDIDDVKNMMSKKESIAKNIIYYENDKMSVLECINKDKIHYIFGNKFEYIEGMCSEKPYLNKYTKQYLVLDVSIVRTKNIVYLTLKDEEDEIIETVLIDNNYDILENNVYNFTFGSYKKEIPNTISDNFKENVLLNIEEVIDK